MNIVDYVTNSNMDFEENIFHLGQKYPNSKIYSVHVSKGNNEDEYQLYFVYDGNFDKEVVKSFITKNGFKICDEDEL